MKSRSLRASPGTTLLLVPAIHRVTHRIGCWLEELGLGVTQGEAHILCHLHERGNCSVAGLHAAFRHRRSTLTSILDRLEDRSLVTRRVHPEDRRSFEVRLTAGGRSLAARVHSHLGGWEQGVLGSLGPRERAVLLSAIAGIGTAVGKDL